MKTRINGQINIYRFDLAKTSKDGGFQCPKCSSKISPDDHSENIYNIVDVTIDNSGLEELMLSCKKCGSLISLTGFPKIQSQHQN